MFHHRSCGTANLVALMAAHRALRDAPGGLQQHEITRLTELLETELAPPRHPGHGPARQAVVFQKN
ncbi:hypothetical protein [Roseomonas sp. 18066]|uniref:hypothetical protein n=1 Tax=Roseomonas sp. 18066 TaxID=2681412 RepID=UPI00135CB542|nr:hypothetical protein [Roseomonas sp. 18066]